MEKAVHVKTKSKWKTVDFDPDFLSAKGFDGLISFEELTDYQLVDTNKPKKRKRTSSKGTKKQAHHADDEKTEEKQKTTSKKKRKKKKKKQNSGQDKIEDLNKALENEPVTGRTVKTNKKQKQKQKQKRKSDSTDAPPKKKMRKDPEMVEPITVEEATTEGPITGMESWTNLFVPDKVLRALKGQGFHEPTPIQVQVLPPAIRDRLDILGAAETGSGKTLAFGIPVLHYILQQKERQGQADPESDTDEDNQDSGVETENAIVHSEEVEDDIEVPDEDEEDKEVENQEDDSKEEVDDGDEAVDSDDEEEQQSDNETMEEDDSEEEVLEELGEDGQGCVQVIKDVDFSWMEEEGQQEEVKPQRTHPRALILEPTRELAIQVKNHLQAAAKYTDITIVTIVGGMSVQKQQRMLKRCPDIIIATPGRLWELVQNGEGYLSELEKTPHLVVDEADRMVEKGHFEELSKLLESMNSNQKLKARRRTYVFSATLTLIHSGPQRTFKKKKKIKLDEKQKLELLMLNIGLKPKPKIVNLTRKVGTVETLTEARINCAKDEKDIYLYYFLKQYPGRTLVFTNSKDCIRRLVSIFTLLQSNPLPLHADMHQRQRLKNLDRFTGNPKGFLIASDVAARGLDIPNVQHVIHYQVPHTVENYVHRSGRTARASKEGLSVVMVGPEDLKNYRKIIHTLNRNEDLPLFPIDMEYMQEVERRVKIVRQIETQEYRFNKSKRQNDWFTKAAEEIGVELDENDRLLNDLGDDVEQNRHRLHIKQMKAELAVILKQPILPGVAGSRYPTQSGQLVKLTRKEDEKNAILNVKKDRKAQQKMVEREARRPLPTKPVKKKKKDKWKKKNKRNMQQE